MSEHSIPQESSFPFDGQKREVDQQRERDGDTAEELRLTYRKTFSTKPGQAVLSDLTRYLTSASFDPNLGFHNGAAYGFWRDGQNNIIRHIIRMTEKI